MAFPTVNRFCMALLYGRAGRLTAQNGGFRRGQVLQKVNDPATHARVAAVLRLMAATLYEDKWWI